MNNYRVKRLIEQAFSEDHGTRLLARAKLKKEFPDVYDIFQYEPEVSK